MPRATTNPAVKVVEFFQTAELATVPLVLALCTAEVQARMRRSREAKARQAPKVVVVAEPTAVVRVRHAVKKKAAKRKKHPAVPVTPDNLLDS